MDQAGVQFQAEGADVFRDQLQQTQASIDALTASINQLASQSPDLSQLSSGVNTVSSAFTSAHMSVGRLLTTMNQIPGVGPMIRGVTGSLITMGGAASSAGAAILTALAPIVFALEAIMAAINLVIGGFQALMGAMADAQGAAESFSEQVQGLENTTGMTEQLAGGFIRVQESVGGSDNAVQNMVDHFSRGMLTAERSMDRFDQRLEHSGSRAANTFDRAGEQWQHAIDNAAEAMQHAIDNAVEQAQERLSDLNDQLDKVRRDYYIKEQQRQEDFNRQIAEDQQALQQRLEDLAESHADRIANINQSIEDNKQSFADDEANRQADLQDKLGSLEEDAQKKRDAINAKYYAPKSEREKQARDEELKLVDEQLAAEELAAKDKAEREEKKAKDAFDRKQKQLQKQIDEENERYQKQTDRLNEEYAKREADAKRSYDRETADAQRAYNDQVEAHQRAVEKINDQEQKAIDQAHYQYQKALDSANFAYQMAAEKFATATSGAVGSILPPMDRFDYALGQLGIKLEDFKKLSFQDQLVEIAQKLDAMPDGILKSSLMVQLLGSDSTETYRLVHKLATEGLQGVIDQGKKVLTPDEQKNVQDYNQALRDSQTAFDDLRQKVGATIDESLLPLLQDFNKFWTLEGPKVVDLLDRLIKYVLPPLIWLAGQFLDILQGWLNNFNSVSGTQENVIGFLESILNMLGPLGTVLSNVVNLFQQLRNLSQGSFTPVINYNPDFYGSEPWMMGHASGGPVHAGQAGMIGELGPEMFVPRTEGYVIPQDFRQNVPATANFNNTSNTDNSTVLNLNISVAGAINYDQGYKAGLGIRDALRAKGVSLAGYAT